MKNITCVDVAGIDDCTVPGAGGIGTLTKDAKGFTGTLGAAFGAPFRGLPTLICSTHYG